MDAMVSLGSHADYLSCYFVCIDFFALFLGFSSSHLASARNRGEAPNILGRVLSSLSRKPVPTRSPSMETQNVMSRVLTRVLLRICNPKK